MNKKRVLSCIQPTGEMHYGNYFGAVQNWVNLQKDYHCSYGIVDYHAMTMPYSPAQLRANVWDLAFSLMAVGIAPENLFIQSLVPEHAELSWILNCYCAYGELTRMTQFKDKSEQLHSQDKENFVSVGLFGYPVLQAADILIYRADFVPVGKDQEQHLELTRNIAQRFNHQTNSAYFSLPAPLYTETPKILSPADPSKKMSKSLGAKHAIFVFSEEAAIRKQIKTAVTGDPVDGVASAGVRNLLEILLACGEKSAHASLSPAAADGTIRFSELKEAVADALVIKSNFFIQEKKQLLANDQEVKQKIANSSVAIRARAQTTLQEVRAHCGLSV